MKSHKGHSPNVSKALVAQEPKINEEKAALKLKNKEQEEDEKNEADNMDVLEVGENDFYTIEKLDEVVLSMTYLARKSSNIRFKKLGIFKGKGQSSSSNINFN